VGNITALSMRFESHCGTGSEVQAYDPATFGQIDYNATAPLLERTLSTESLSLISPGGGPVSQAVSVTNSGTAPVSPTFALAGANASDFSVINGCPSQLSAGHTCSFSILYQPGLAAHSMATFEYFDALSPSQPLAGPGEVGTGEHVALLGTNSAFTGELAYFGPGFVHNNPGSSMGSAGDDELPDVEAMAPDGYTLDITALNGDTGSGYNFQIFNEARTAITVGTYVNTLLVEEGGGSFNGGGCGNGNQSVVHVDDIAFDGSGNLTALSIRIELSSSSLNSPMAAPPPAAPRWSLPIARISSAPTPSLTPSRWWSSTTDHRPSIRPVFRSTAIRPTSSGSTPPAAPLWPLTTSACST
jgi:hypothetical protein